MSKWRARGENSQISWVLFRSSTVSGGLRVGGRAVHVPHAHARLQWVGCTLHLPGVAWEKSSGDDVGQLYRLHSQLQPYPVPAEAPPHPKSPGKIVILENRCKIVMQQ